MSPQTLIDCAFPGTFAHVSDHLKKLQVELERNAVEPEPKDDILIVLAELLNNIVEHGYCASGKGNIHLTVHAHKRPDKNAVYIRTIDQGPPVPADALIGASLPSLTKDIQHMPEGGFGWFMIHTLTDSINYERIDDENRFTFCVGF